VLIDGAAQLRLDGIERWKGLIRHWTRLSRCGSAKSRLVCARSARLGTTYC
jgi:hypothetical protein